MENKIKIRKNNVKKRRLTTNFTQKEVAKRLSISLSVYRDIENNKRNLKYIYIRKLVDFFNISINQLFD